MRLIAACLSLLLASTAGEPPIFEQGGYGGSGGDDHGEGYGSGNEVIATKGSSGVKYAGPIVYTNEKPPVIYFPPPPKPSSSGGYSKGGSKGPSNGWNLGGLLDGSDVHGGSSSVKYVPLPHHDLPILIYQSDANPPIHVVNPPEGHSSSDQGGYSAPSYSAPGPSHSGGYQSSSIVSNYAPPPPKDSYSAPSSSYSVPSSSSSYSAPSVNSHSSSSSSYSAPGPSYGAPESPKNSYGPPPQSYGAPKGGKAQPLPHIIYSGHPPIHIFQSAPISLKGSSQEYGPPPPPLKVASSSTYTFKLPSNAAGPPAPYGGSGGPKGGPKGGKGGPKGGSKGSDDESGWISGPPPGFKGGSKKGGSSHLKTLHQNLKNVFSMPKGWSFSFTRGNEGGHGGKGGKSGGKSSGGWTRSGKSVPITPTGTSGPSGSSGPSKGDLYTSASSTSTQYGPPPSSKSSKKAKKYVVAPKAWNKPPIIIYQGVRPPVHVFPKGTKIEPAYGPPPSSGGYSDLTFAPSQPYPSVVNAIPEGRKGIQEQPQSQFTILPSQLIAQFQQSQQNTPQEPQFFMMPQQPFYVQDLSGAGSEGQGIWIQAPGGKPGSPGNPTQQPQIESRSDSPGPTSSSASGEDSGSSYPTLVHGGMPQVLHLTKDQIESISQGQMFSIPIPHSFTSTILPSGGRGTPEEVQGN